MGHSLPCRADGLNCDYYYLNAKLGLPVLHREVAPPVALRFQFAHKLPLHSTPRSPIASLGGIFVIDLFLELIALRFSAAIADQVAQNSSYVHVCRVNRHTSFRRSWRLGINSKHLPEAFDLMEANVEQRLTIAEIPDRLDVSQRTLQRICKRELGTSPNHIYSVIQLERVRSLLLNTQMLVAEVSLACGFSTISHF